MKTSEIIQYRRKFLGMTLEQVADAVGVNKSTIMRYERGDIEKMSVQNLVPAPYIKKPHNHAVFHFRDTTMILKKKVLSFSFNLFPDRFLYESHS